MAAIDDARNYIGAAFGPTYDAWMALTSDQQSKTLVSATRLFNALPWQGTATGTLNGDPTSLVWPRSGVIVGGVPVDSTTIPLDIVNGSFELAVAIAAKPALVNAIDQGSNLRSVQGGGGVGAEFFAPTSAALGTATVLPVQVQRLVGKYLESPSDEGSFGAAGGRCSAFGRHRQFTLAWPED